jgi:UDP-N-acetylmuramoyl-L-alanyl-D-glutamate--2,6-diaminopimelate ligase
LDQSRVSGVQFCGAVFTNLGRDHLDYHGDLDAYATAKQQLFARPELEFAVINLSDPAAESMLQVLAPLVRRIGYTSHTAEALAADVLYAQNIRSGLDGLRFEVVWNGDRCDIHTRLLGRFNVDNVLAVMGVLLAQGLSLDTVAARIADLRSIPGRMETFGVVGQTPLVIVDYAHTADALDTVLSSLRAHGPAHLITVFGCGGDRDAGKRSLMGRAAEMHSDRVIVTDDNPRHESQSEITDQILCGMQSPDQVEVIHDRKKAIETALNGAGAGDIVLIAGKGHETTQQIGDQLYQFSDRQRVREALLKWRGAAQSESGWTQ